MVLILKKKIYNTVVQQKNLYAFSTYNRTLNEHKFSLNLKKQNLYTIYILSQYKNKPYIKKITGILLKKNKMKNLTNLHLLCLKRYNNIYLSFFKESPNILIKYKI